MKLIKVLAEEFPMFNQFDPDGMENDDFQTGSDLSSTSFDSIEGKPEDEEECVCQCDCPCCSAKKGNEMQDDDDDSVDNGQHLDFSAAQTGANLEDPNSSSDKDNEFSFNF